MEAKLNKLIIEANDKRIQTENKVNTHFVTFYFWRLHFFLLNGIAISDYCSRFDI